MARLLTVAVFVALVNVSGVAHAQNSNARLESTRRAIDASAQKWFEAQNRASAIDARVHEIEHDIELAQAHADDMRQVAAARALVMYESSSQYSDVFGSSAIESARRAQLMGHANAQNEDALDAFAASLDHLKAQRKSLVAEQSRQRKVLADVASERANLDTQLTALIDAAQHDAAGSARKTTSSRKRVAGSTQAPTSPGGQVSNGGAPPAGNGVSAHHNDPFLVCTRARESGGNYGAVSRSGYYGAYQFLPSTWNATANHAGRHDLVGVLPSRASVYDQDEMAWALYQWQGKGPWGGRC